MEFIGLSIMNLIRRHQAEADMVMRVIIPHEEHAAELPGVLDTAEIRGKAVRKLIMAVTALHTSSGAATGISCTTVMTSVPTENLIRAGTGAVMR